MHYIMCGNVTNVLKYLRLWPAVLFGLSRYHSTIQKINVNKRIIKINTQFFYSPTFSFIVRRSVIISMKT